MTITPMIMSGFESGLLAIGGAPSAASVFDRLQVKMSLVLV